MLFEKGKPKLELTRVFKNCRCLENYNKLYNTSTFDIIVMMIIYFAVNRNSFVKKIQHKIYMGKSKDGLMTLSYYIVTISYYVCATMQTLAIYQYFIIKSLENVR